MAKQKEDLTLQERLDKALVADWEQPYGVPDNWVWTRLPEAFYNATSSNKKLPQKQYLLDGEYPIVDQGKEQIGGYCNDESLLYSDSLPVILFGDHTRVIKYIDFPFVQGADGVKLLNPKEYWNGKCFYYALQSVGILDLGYRRHFPLFPTFSIPLPPLAEQQRIVNRIESLFAKLDSAKELAQTALDTFENRKAAILHKAFTGELTKKIIGDNVNDLIDSIKNVKDDLIKQKKIKKQKVTPINEEDIKYTLPKNWKFIKLGEVAFVTKLAGFEYTKHIHLTPKGDVPAIRAQNVRKGFLDKENLLYIDKETSNILHRSALTKKSILVTFIGAGIGDVCLFNEKTRFHLAPNVAKCEVYNGENELLLPEYVLYYLLSEYGQSEIFKHMKATAQPSLSMETIRDIVIPITSFKEQTEIVRILDSLFEKETHAKELTNVIEKITLMKKAILARAFRGKLGTNNPTEESAKELLTSILEKN